MTLADTGSSGLLQAELLSWNLQSKRSANQTYFVSEDSDDFEDEDEFDDDDDEDDDDLDEDEDVEDDIEEELEESDEVEDVGVGVFFLKLAERLSD